MSVRQALRRTMQALQASFAGVRVAHKAQERTRRATAVVRAADDGKVTTGATRSKDTLYLGGIGASEQGLTYLDRSLPADYGCVEHGRPASPRALAILDQPCVCESARLPSDRAAAQVRPAGPAGPPRGRWPHHAGVAGVR